MTTTPRNGLVRPKLLVGLLGLVLAGCGTTPGTSAEPSASAPGSTTTPLATATATEAAPEIPDTLIAYTRDGTVIVRDLQGGPERTIDAPEFSAPVALTIDRRHLIVIEPIDPYTSMVAAYPVDDGERAELGQVPTGSTPKPSPDGRWLAFASDGAPGNGLLLVSLETAEATRLTADGATAPVWAPDGRSIAYQRYDLATMRNDLAVVDVATGVSAQLTDDEPEDIPFAWTDDGTAVLETSHRGGDGTRLDIAVWEVAVADGALTERPGYWFPDVISVPAPDGRYDAVFSARGFLEIAEPGDGQGHVIDPNAQATTHLTWAPGSDWLIYAAGVDGAADLFLVRVPDGEPINLTRTPGDEAFPVWGPIYHGS